MSKKEQAAILDECTDTRKPYDLTDKDVFQLMETFTRDKTLVTEEDCLILCRWAQARKLGAYVLQLVLEGRVAVTVEADTVKLGPLAPHPRERGSAR